LPSPSGSTKIIAAVPSAVKRTALRTTFSIALRSSSLLPAILPPSFTCRIRQDSADNS
jgi:hypothetical protein